MTYPKSLRNDAAAGMLEIVWDDDTGQKLDNAMLRRRCQCADCKSLRLHSGAELKIDARTSIREIRIVGHYAAQFIFSDGHDRGIFPWIYLRDMISAAKSETA